MDSTVSWKAVVVVDRVLIELLPSTRARRISGIVLLRRVTVDLVRLGLRLSKNRVRAPRARGRRMRIGIIGEGERGRRMCLKNETGGNEEDGHKHGLGKRVCGKLGGCVS